MSVPGLLETLALAALTVTAQDPDLEPLILLRDRLRSIQSIRSVAERRDEDGQVRFRTTYTQGPRGRVWRNQFQSLMGAAGGIETFLDGGRDEDGFSLWIPGMEEVERLDSGRKVVDLNGACFADFFCRAWAMPLIEVLDRSPVDRELDDVLREEGLSYHVFDLPEAGEAYAVALGFAAPAHRPLRHLILLREGRRGVDLLVTEWREDEKLGEVPQKGRRRFGETAVSYEEWVFSSVEFDVELGADELQPVVHPGR